MNKSNRFLLPLAVIMILSLVLGACRSNSKDGSTAEPAKEITIQFPTIWVGKDSKAKTVKQLIDDFNEQKKGKIRVVTEEIPDYSAYADKIRTSITTGTPPDIFSFGNSEEAALYYKSGNLADLTPYLDESWKSTFLPKVFDGAVYNDKVYSIPFEFGVTPALYNTRLFEKAGIKEFPKTYTELFAAFDKLKAVGINAASQQAGGNGWTSMLWYSQLLSAIGGKDVYKNGLDDPAFLEAAKVLKKLYDYTTPDALGLNNTAATFLTEQAAVLLNGPWFIGRIKNEGVNNLYDAVQVAPAPVYEGGKGEQGQYIGFIQASLAVGKQTDKNKERAIVEFLKYLTKPDNVKRISLDSGSLFAIKYNVAPEDKVDRLQAEIQKQVLAAPYIIPHFQASVKPAVATEFPQALSGLILGKYTPEQFVQQLKKAGEK